MTFYPISIDWIVGNRSIETNNARPDERFDSPSGAMIHGFVGAPDRRLGAIVGYVAEFSWC
jgi:hypothetical protein